jgi:hypothetical protein
MRLRDLSAHRPSGRSKSIETNGKWMQMISAVAWAHGCDPDALPPKPEPLLPRLEAIVGHFQVPAAEPPPSTKQYIEHEINARLSLQQQIRPTSIAYSRIAEILAKRHRYPFDPNRTKKCFSVVRTGLVLVEHPEPFCFSSSCHSYFLHRHVTLLFLP